MMYWLGYLTCLLVGLTLGLGLLRFTLPGGQARSALRSRLANFALAGLVLFLSLMAAELYFKLFFAQSDAYFFTLAAQNWQERYWQPINSLGYRDREWTAEAVAGKLKVAVVGDSIAAGVGINNYEDRFSNVLNQLLGDETVVFNVASPGWSTRREIEAIVSYPYRPDILILTYFINDIEGAAYHQGLKQPRVVRDPSPLWQPLIQNSYAINFMYWRLARFGQREGQAAYLAWVAEIFNNPEVWWVHQQELQTIYDGTRSEGIPLIVVIFPNLTTLAESRQFVAPVAEFFQSRGVPVLDVSHLLAGSAPQALTASPVDSHPNEVVHWAVAEQLAQLIEAVR
jgi:lysophospholipase L1-like esterase